MATVHIVCLTMIICVWSVVSAQDCKDNMDCALYGDCVNGICKCEKGWTGKHCTTLDLLPMALDSGFHDPMNTWGGSPIQIFNGSNSHYYMLATIIGKGNPERIWCTQATIALAQSKQPAGPYQYVVDIANITTVNCTGVINPVIIAMNNNQGYLLYYTCAQCVNDKNDTFRCEDPAHCLNTLRVSYIHSNDLSDVSKWVHDPKPLFLPNNTNWEQGDLDNPGPIVLPNNSVIMAYRGDHDTSVGLVFANQWNQSQFYSRLNNGNDLFGNIHGLEDPFMWKSKQGYHMLLHNTRPPQNTDVGTIAWSKNGVSDWRLNVKGEGVYGHVIMLANGTKFTCTRREEPKLLFDRSNNDDDITGIPIYLANVCLYGNDEIFVSMVPINQNSNSDKQGDRF